LLSYSGKELAQSNSREKPSKMRLNLDGSK
jgi:hypothetical protein